MKLQSLTILGAGVIGLSVARQARLRGLPVRVLDSRSFGTSCSHAATGVLKAPEHRRSPYLDLRHQSWEEWPQLAEQLKDESGGVDCGFRICGGLDLRDRTVQDPHRALEKLHGSGGNVRVLDQQELQRLLPEMHREPQAGLYIEHQAVVDPDGLMEALRRSCLGMGVEITDDLGEISLGIEEGHRIVRSSLETPLPPIDEKNPLVLSAGWETSALINPALVKPLPLKPVRGEAIALDIPAPPHIVTFDAKLADVDDPSGNRSRFSWIPGPGGSSWFGNSVGDTGEGKETLPEPTATGRARLIEAAISFFGSGVESRIVRHWAGLRPKSLRHGGPLMGPIDTGRTLWIASGHYRTGLLIGPKTAEWLVDSLTGKNEILENFSIPEEFRI
ncbi:MAG: NAD(P)/FAD-dependent oxidoreductase [Planctomycetota bacterium]